MDPKKEIADKLRLIQALWIEQEKMEVGSPEHEALLEKIRVLAAEYHKLVDASKKP
jgi:hypothetical protein